MAWGSPSSFSRQKPLATQIRNRLRELEVDERLVARIVGAKAKKEKGQRYMIVATMQPDHRLRGPDLTVPRNITQAALTLITVM